MMFRLNPLRSVFDRKIRPQLERDGWRALGRTLPRRPIGCGTFGCVFRRESGWVTKVTTDPFEVRMITLIRKLRKAPTKNTAAVKRALRDTGVSVQRAGKLPGIVEIATVAKRVGKTWQYVREDVDPAVGMSDAGARARMKDLRKGLDWFFYSSRRPSVREVLRRHPRLRLIIATALYLEAAHGLQLEDLHEEQVGRVRRVGKLHAPGEYVLYDGQVEQ